MNFNYLTNTPLGTALNEYITVLKEKNIRLGEEKIPLTQALGRVSANAVYACQNSPHYNAGAMDGIAVRASDTLRANVLDPVRLSEGQFIIIDTGDPVPSGYDAVVMMEDVVWKDGGAFLSSPAAQWQHIRQIGEDICVGDMVISSYTKINAYQLAALAASGIREVPVLEKIRITIIPTGDELVPLDNTPEKGEIPEFNSLMITAMLRDESCIIKTHPIVSDNKDDLNKALEESVKDSHLVLINAGSSAGRDDYTAAIIAQSGEVCFHGLAVKPGKPTILGICGFCAVIGIPGYPVSAAVVIQEIVLHIKEYFLGLPVKQTLTPAILSRRVVSGLKYEEFIRVRLSKTGDKLMAVPVAGGAGVVTSLSKADALARIPQSCEGFEAGEEIQCELFNDLSEIENSLVIIGSHDPIIDEISDIMRLDSGARVSSVHVGSMGGIMAIKRGEAHIAPVHLLDESDGSYNTTYIKKYLPEKQLTLIKGVRRMQGLMVRKGNPENIRGIKDLLGKQYVNRQKSAGTRILFDMLLKKEGIDPQNIAGYTNEQLTHTAVAVAVKEGNADAGMGIYSAAVRLGLDFIEICEEEYDFIIPDRYIGLPAVQDFLCVLHSGIFWERAARMGGYKKPYES
jgi:putative molybdopterin biosynthesis protein